MSLAQERRPQHHNPSTQSSPGGARRAHRGGIGGAGNALTRQLLAERVPDAYDRATQGGSTELPFFEQMQASFDADLSSIPVFMGQEGLRDAGASAVAGPDGIAFSSRQPDSSEVGEEVAHYLQGQQGGGASSRAVSDPTQASEREAKTAGRRASNGGAAGVSQAQGGLQCNLWDDFFNAVGDGLDMRENEAELDAHEELEAFRATGFPASNDFKPSSGIGQFDAAFDAASGQLNITLKVGYDFQTGDSSAVSPGFRPAEFQWSDAEKDAWKAKYMADVEAMWSAQHRFQSTKPFWESMMVDVSVDIVEDNADPHFILAVEKFPADSGMAQSSVCPPGTEHNAAGNRCPSHTDDHGTGAFDSNDLRDEQKLDRGNAKVPVYFRRGSSTLDSRGRRQLAPVSTQMQAAPSMHAEVEGRASSDHRSTASQTEGEVENMDIARARSAAVVAALGGDGIAADRLLVRNRGEEGATAGEEWCRVDVQLGSQQMQNPALHETGHMLGLGDEYPTRRAPAGTAVGAKYDALVRAQDGRVLTRTRDESAMSVGSTVKTWHYSSFLEALKSITNSQDWKIA